jgi:YHS domain-containing protein
MLPKMRLALSKLFVCVACITGGQFALSPAYGQAAAAASPGSQSSQSTSDVNKTRDGVAVKGYDVVSYFDQKKPLKGNPKYSYQYAGAKYEFVSAEHLAMFQNNPESYLPQYGGYARSAPQEATKLTSTPKPGPSSMVSST